MTAYAFAHLRDRRSHPDVFVYLERVQATLDPSAAGSPRTGRPPRCWRGLARQRGAHRVPGLAEARAWYDSPAYQDILRLRTDHIRGTCC
ncbi:DUF1330 domain-containing protein [Streptomyces sp. M19]